MSRDDGKSDGGPDSPVRSIHSVEFRLRIMFPENHLSLSPAMCFNAWLPTTEQDSIQIEHGNIRVRLWCDILSASWAIPIPETDFARYPALGAHYIIADVLHKAPSVAAMNELQSNPKPLRHPEDAAPNLAALANEIASAAYEGVNALIRYVKSTKGQYWLVGLPTELRDGKSMLRSARPEYRVGDGKWLPCPFPWVPVLRVRVGQATDRTLTREDWREAGSHLSLHQPPVSPGHELLAAAEWLSWIGQHRSALAECVAALEAELDEFASSAQGKSRYAQCQAGRNDCASLSGAMKKLGMTGSVRFLLPILFDETELPSELLRQCNATIEARNAAMHQQARRIGDTWNRIQSMRSLCCVLRAR